MAQPDPKTALTVSELTNQIKAVLLTGFADVWVLGEISSLKFHSSGHVYFSLRDPLAVVSAVVWRTTAARLPFQPQEGLEVFARGRLDVYAPQGKYNLVVNELHPKGLGAQDLALRQLKEKLSKLGYFDPERKKPLPRFPRRLALVTSPSGAAVRDMLEILGRRWPLGEVLIVPVRVQGPTAGLEIAAALERLNAVPNLDTILLGRGGGSYEDLAAFNEEAVAKAIFQSRHPIVSAVGHEIDVTLADLVADRRALTPSEAAELATPDRVEILQWLTSRRQRLSELLQGRVLSARDRLRSLAERRVLVQPVERFHELARRLDDLQERLVRAGRGQTARQRQRLDAQAAQLESLSPLNVLARGYSLTRKLADGRVVRSVRDVRFGDPVQVLVADGRLDCRVEGAEKTDSGGAKDDPPTGRGAGAKRKRGGD